MLGLVQRLVDFTDKRLLRFAWPPGSDANADRQRRLMIDQDGASVSKDRLRQSVQLGPDRPSTIMANSSPPIRAGWTCSLVSFASCFPQRK